LSISTAQKMRLLRYSRSALLIRFARLSRKGQVTLPAEVRKLLNVRSGARVRFVVEKDAARILPVEGESRRSKTPLRFQRCKISKTPAIKQWRNAAVKKARALDANIILHFLTNDVPEQANRCAELLN